MRIIGGTRGGRKLVDWQDSGIRPVRDFVRSAVFSIVEDFVPGSVCLDLFAGTGSLGLEALSRGARRCLFVDASPDACAMIRKNLEAFDLLEAGEVHEGDWAVALDHYGRRGRRFDLVFVDPPYYQGFSEMALRRLGGGDVLGDDPLVVVATSHREGLEEAAGVLELADRRRYGDNAVAFYRRGEDTARSDGVEAEA